MEGLLVNYYEKYERYSVLMNQLEELRAKKEDYISDQITKTNNISMILGMLILILIIINVN